MSFSIYASTDVGLVKQINQDSYSIKVANAPIGQIAFAVLCDGMGGFSKGELASGSVVNMFSDWFINNLPNCDLERFSGERLFNEWNEMVVRANNIISEYGLRNNIKLGTTLTAMLFIGGVYYCINVGDSRAYLIRKDNIWQITKDHTLVQRELDLGNITNEEALIHPQRNVLLQCIGCSRCVQPDFYCGEYECDDVFLLCSDGFRHEIRNEEIVKAFSNKASDNIDYNMQLHKLIELNKSRREADNITALIIKIQMNEV